MSPKKRVYELAKEYGISGQDLATKLRDLGFAQIKSHMAALDDFLLLQVQGVLEAHGLVARQGVEDSEGDDSESKSSDGLIVRRKKKKKRAEAPAPAPAPKAAPAPAEAAPTAEPEPAAAQASVEAPPVEPAPPAEVAPARPATAHPAPEAQAATRPAQPPVETPAEAPAEEPEPAAAVDEGEDDVLPRPAEVVHAEAAAEPEEAEADDEAGADDEKGGSKRKGPAGKVVGFVDLSKIQSPTPRKSESRRLRSKDDVAPDVRPTLGHDRKRAFMRGDAASRGQLTAAQLREKEAGRFLRRRALGGPGGDRGGRDRGGRGMRRDETMSSPHAGQKVTVESPITIKKLADAISVKAGEVLKKAVSLIGFGVNINSTLDDDTAVLLAGEFQVELEVKHVVAAEAALLEELVQARSKVEDEALRPRPPIIAFLGHVDHGKTTLLDHLRRSRVVHGESGGITQHLGAYQVETKKHHRVTVLDTPGHEAFTRMRARGAEAVDIVVLVVAAEDGVKPSTVEAINHARAAKTPIVVAINKIDKPDADPDRVVQQLAGLELTPEEWGGQTAMMRVSALTGQGVEELMERVFLESEVLELRAHTEGVASGVVLEAEVQEGKGRVAYLLVQDGSLNQGDIILAGEGYGRVRSIHDDRGRQIQNAGPSTPVEVSGLSELPSVGDRFYVVEKLEQAREVAEERSAKNRALSLAERRQVTKENLLQAVAAQNKKVVNIILKADVQGSLEALRPQLESMTHDEVEVRLVHSGLGTITESDVDLAVTSEALILGFHVSANDKARQAADRGGVEIHHYEVIYELLDAIRAIMEGALAPEMSEEITGHLEVRRVFKSSKLGNIAGCIVRDGAVRRDHKVRVKRGDAVLHTGSIASLRREADDAKEVREGFECGCVLRDFDAFEEGDVIEAYKLVAVKRLLKI